MKAPKPNSVKRERLMSVLVTLAGAVVGGLLMGQFTLAAGGDPAVVRVAASQLGVTESPYGSNAGARVNVFTQGNHEAWCADFVSWVYKQAGHPLSGGIDGWRNPSAEGVRRWFAQRGWFHARGGSSQPQPGDVVNFDYKGISYSHHIGIVEGVSGTTLYTIEGNTSNGVHRRTYSNYRTDRRIMGWSRMEGESGVDQQVSCPSPHPMLQAGATGVCVAEAQTLMAQKLGVQLASDGVFGEQTDAAVRCFQSQEALLVDGQVGPRTWQALER